MKNQENQLTKMTSYLRLKYYNDYLLEKGLISKREHQKLGSAILAKYHVSNCLNNYTK